jgi:hypothetical protein
MKAARFIVTAVFAAAVALGCAGCSTDTTSPPPVPNPTGELSDIQTTLDNIDADIAAASAP